MAVSVNATGTASHTASGTSLTNTGLTIASGSNTVLLVAFGVSGPITSPSAKWDNTGTPQTMTLIGSVANGGNTSTYFYGLLNPTVGNKTLALAWTNTVECYTCAIAFDGADTSAFANAFNNFNSNVTSSTAPSVTITSATGNAVVAFLAAINTLSAPTQTQIFLDNSGADCYAMQRAAGAASVACGWTQSPASGVSIAGCNISAAAAASSPANNPPSAPVAGFSRTQLDAQGQKNLGLLTQPVPMGQILM